MNVLVDKHLSKEIGLGDLYDLFLFYDPMCFQQFVFEYSSNGLRLFQFQ